MTVLLILGAIFVGGGIAVYTGRWRSWAARYRLRPHILFGLLYMGIGLWFLAPAAELDRHSHHALALLFEVPAGICAVLLTWSLFRLPSWLLPGWYREEATRRGTVPPYVGRTRG